MPGLLDFLRDRESQKGMGQGLLDAANRGMVAGTLGAPVDMATQVANLGVAGVGYLGHKLGLLQTPPDLIDSRTVPGSSEWIGQKMRTAGMVTENRNPIAEAGMGLLSPVAYMGAQKAGKALYQAEQNAAKPSTMGMQAQRGAVAWHGTPYKFDRFDSSKIGTGEGGDKHGRGLNFAGDPEVAFSYAKQLTFPSAGVGSKAADLMQSLAYDKRAAEKKLLESAKEARAQKYDDFAIELFGHPAKSIQQEMAALRRGLNIYKVDVPDSAVGRMIDMNAPIDAAPAVVQEYYKRMGQYKAGASMRDHPPIPTEAAQAFSNAGVPGIKYLHDGSRGGSSKSTNYVVFPGNEGLLSILERNGQPIR